MARIEFAAPAHMENLADLRGWPLGEPPATGAEVLIDLSRWQRVTPNPVAGLTAVVAYLARLGNTPEIVWPADAYAQRMLHTAGFFAALETFEDWLMPDAPEAVKRILPIIPVRNFRTHGEADDLAVLMQETFSVDDRLPASLVHDAGTALVEAADNVIWHAESEAGGFALAQMRRRRERRVNRWLIEIAVADCGRGIRASLGNGEDDRDAVRQALQEGVTGSGDRHRGYGLAHMAELARRPRRLLTVHSGDGFAACGLGYDLLRQAGARFPGTLITMSMPAG